MKILPGIRLINGNQRGFTLLELLVALAIDGIIACSLAGITFQLFTISKNSTDHMTAIKQVENAGYWLSNDALMDQTARTDSYSYSSFNSNPPLTLKWEDWNNEKHSIEYTINNGELKRKQTVYINDIEQPSTTKVIARYIADDSEMTGYRYIGGVLEFKICAQVPQGSQGSKFTTETRNYTVVPRSG